MALHLQSTCLLPLVWEMPKRRKDIADAATLNQKRRTKHLNANAPILILPRYKLRYESRPALTPLFISRTEGRFERNTYQIAQGPFQFRPLLICRNHNEQAKHRTPKRSDNVWLNLWVAVKYTLFLFLTPKEREILHLTCVTDATHMHHARTTMRFLELYRANTRGHQILLNSRICLT